MISLASILRPPSDLFDENTISPRVTAIVKSNTETNTISHLAESDFAMSKGSEILSISGKT